MKDISTPVPPNEVRAVIKKSLENAALVNYERLSEEARIEGIIILNISFTGSYSIEHVSPSLWILEICHELSSKDKQKMGHRGYKLLIRNRFIVHLCVVDTAHETQNKRSKGSCPRRWTHHTS